MASYRILVVEDEEDIHELLLITMRRDKHQVVGAKSGEEAVALLRRETFDLIILDIMLPEQNGFEVLAVLNTVAPAVNTPVILLSALANPQTVIQGLSGGAVDYITKPFSVGELSARVKLHLQLKAANDGLRESEKKLRSSLAAKEKFFRIIAHDLRGPISALHGYVRLMTTRKEDWPREKQDRCLRTLEETSANVSALLENLLQWAQTDNLRMQPEELNLQSLCLEAAAPLRGTLADKNIRLRLEITAAATVYADRQAIATVLRNLLANAGKYTHPGGSITVAAREVENRQEITVTDSGVGIAASDLDKLFRIDAHHSTPGTGNEKGTGLGLILCREFVEKNQGEITARSTPGKGSSFIFTLPRARPADTFGEILAPEGKTDLPLRHPQTIRQDRAPLLPA